MEKFEFVFTSDLSDLPEQRGKYAEYFEAFKKSPEKVMKINCVNVDKLKKFANSARLYKKKNNLDFCIIAKAPYLYLVKS